MKAKIITMLAGITLAILLLILLQSKAAQALIGLWLLGGLVLLCCNLAESFLTGFRKGLERRSINEQK